MTWLSSRVHDNRDVSGGGKTLRLLPQVTHPDSRQLMPFPRYFSTAEPDMIQRQERQIVQSWLNLDGFLP